MKRGSSAPINFIVFDFYRQSTFTFVQTSENDISVDFTRTDMDGSIEVYVSYIVTKFSHRVETSV